MAEKTVGYNRVIFPPETIKQAQSSIAEILHASFREILKEKDVFTLGGHGTIHVSEEEIWTYDTEEEFFSEYRRNFISAEYKVSYTNKNTHFPAGDLNISVSGIKSNSPKTSVSISLHSRDDIEKVFGIFEAAKEACYLPQTALKIFIGHGHTEIWKELKDHLHEKHGYDVEAYEIGARAGLSITDVLDAMLTQSTMALLVLTGEDEDKDGKLHARENVVHELGLFQGRLGWNRAIAVMEDGVSEFSNIRGIQQIRFKAGNIKETYGEILATIRREFLKK